MIDVGWPYREMVLKYLWVTECKAWPFKHCKSVTVTAVYRYDIKSPEPPPYHNRIRTQDLKKTWAQEKASTFGPCEHSIKISFPEASAAQRKILKLLHPRQPAASGGSSTRSGSSPPITAVWLDCSLPVQQVAHLPQFLLWQLIT